MSSFEGQTSERLKFLLSGMAYTSENDEELNAALNWFYLALVLGMADPLAAAGLLLELEDQPAWTEEYMKITRENVDLALDRSGRFIEAKEAIA